MRYLTLSLMGLMVINGASAAVDCKPVVSSPNGKSTLKFDLTPLAGLHEASKETSTPPTTQEARVQLNVCGDDSIPYNDDLAEEDQCPSGTKLCLTLWNHKPSSNEPGRVTAVIPIWTKDTAESDIRLRARKNEEGLDLEIDGPEYADRKQKLRFELLCSESADDENPQLDSYSDGLLTLSWSTRSACPRGDDDEGRQGNDENDRSDDPGSGGRRDGGGSFGIWSFFKTIFWLSAFGLLAYFVIGIYYNYTTYGSRGMDLLPHREFWQDAPRMAGDLVGHVVTGVRGRASGSGRGGYQSLG